jgi:hypothetical protein
VLAGEFMYGWRAHAQGQPIKLGAPLPLTGPAAPLGQRSLWGTQATLRVIEGRGGIAGRPLQLIVEDDGGRPADAVKIMRKMILQDQVDAIIGGASSVDTVPMLPVAQETETLLLVTERDRGRARRRGGDAVRPLAGLRLRRPPARAAVDRGDRVDDPRRPGHAARAGARGRAHEPRHRLAALADAPVPFAVGAITLLVVLLAPDGSGAVLGGRGRRAGAP